MKLKSFWNLLEDFKKIRYIYCMELVASPGSFFEFAVIATVVLIHGQNTCTGCPKEVDRCIHNYLMIITEIPGFNMRLRNFCNDSYSKNRVARLHLFGTKVVRFCTVHQGIERNRYKSKRVGPCNACVPRPCHFSRPEKPYSSISSDF